jgi:hypothetical protein
VSDINTRAREVMEKAALSNQAVLAAVAAAHEQLNASKGQIGSTSTEIGALKTDLAAADVTTVDAIALLTQAHPLCDSTSQARDAVVALALKLLGIVGDEIALRQLVKELHVVSAQIEVKKAESEDVFGDLTGLQNALPALPPAAKGAKKKTS